MAVDMKDCPPYLKEYIFYLRVIRNRSEKTIESYYIDLRLFLRYIKENIISAENCDIIADVPFSAVAGITLADVYEYLNFSAEVFNFFSSDTILKRNTSCSDVSSKLFKLQMG